MNYKKIFNVVGVGAAFVLTGCTTSTVMNDGGSTLDGGKYVELTPRVVTTLTLADLEVLEKKVTGTAQAFITTNTDRTNLEKEAVAKALAQKDGADVLVVTSFYYNTSDGKSSPQPRLQTRVSRSPKRTSSSTTYDDGVSIKRYLTVTVVGYPARYKNFRTYEPKNDDGYVVNTDSSQNNTAIAPAAVPVHTPPAIISPSNAPAAPIIIPVQTPSAGALWK